MKEIDEKESTVIFKEGLNYAYFEPIREEEENSGSEDIDFNSHSNKNKSGLLESIVMQEDMEVEKVESRKVNFNNTFGEFGESATLKDELLMSGNDNEKERRQLRAKKINKLRLVSDIESSSEEEKPKKRSTVSVEKVKDYKKKFSLNKVTKRKLTNKTYSTIERNCIEIGQGGKKNNKRKTQYLREHSGMRVQPERCFKSFTSNNKNNRQLDTKNYVLSSTKRSNKRKRLVDLNKLLRGTKIKEQRRINKDDGFFINVHKQGRKGSLAKKKKDYIQY